MATQRLGAKKLKRLREKTGLDIEIAIVRGGWNLSIKLLLADLTVAWLHKDGSIEYDDYKWQRMDPEEAKSLKEAIDGK